MVGLCVEGEPLLGVVFQPLGGILYRGILGEGAFVEENGATRPLRVVDRPDPRGCRLISSASHRTAHIDRVRETLGISDEMSLGSVGLKVALIARGERDLYVNPEGFSKLWDSCAPQALLTAAGGVLSDIWGRPIDYRSKDIRNRDGLVACSRTMHPAVIAALGPLFPRP